MMLKLLLSSLAVFGSFKGVRGDDTSSWSGGSYDSDEDGLVRNSYCGDLDNTAVYLEEVTHNGEPIYETSVRVGFKDYFKFTINRAYADSYSETSYMFLDTLESVGTRYTTSSQLSHGYKKLSSAHLGPRGEGVCVFVEQAQTGFATVNVAGNITEKAQIVDEREFQGGRVEYSMSFFNMTTSASMNNLVQCYVIASKQPVVPDLDNNMVSFEGQRGNVLFGWEKFMECRDEGSNARIPVNATWGDDVQNIDRFDLAHDYTFHKICFSANPAGCSTLYWDPNYDTNKSSVIDSSTTTRATIKSLPKTTTTSTMTAVASSVATSANA